MALGSAYACDHEGDQAAYMRGDHRDRLCLLRFCDGCWYGRAAGSKLRNEFPDCSPRYAPQIVSRSDLL